MHWNVILLWMFGEIELTLAELYYHHSGHLEGLDEEDIRHLPDWFRVISNASVNAKIETIRQIAKADFISSTLVEMEERMYNGN